VTSVRTALLIAFHFPPIQGSSGVQRTLRFAQHLPKFGWRPIVLTIDPRAYEATATVVGNEIPNDLLVQRAFGFNTAKQLSIFGRYPQSLALPDRWMTWRYWAIPKALDIIRQYQVDVIWSTFPITTAHSVAMEVAKRTGLPWVAEFRDPMWQVDWPLDARANRAWQALEAKIVKHADRLVLVAPSAVNLYAERYALPAAKLVLLENGYDEETFQRATVPEARAPGPIVLLHSGIIYSSERDPTQFFAAVAALKAKGLVAASTLQIILRASGSEANYQSDLERLNIADIVRFVHCRMARDDVGGWAVAIAGRQLQRASARKALRVSACQSTYFGTD
jgi:glycosyltransferase involved in cell wall biosynthesis